VLRLAVLWLRLRLRLRLRLLFRRDSLLPRYVGCWRPRAVGIAESRQYQRGVVADSIVDRSSMGRYQPTIRIYI
jgi:hypothetical protein